MSQILVKLDVNKYNGANPCLERTSQKHSLPERNFFQSCPYFLVGQLLLPHIMHKYSWLTCQFSHGQF